MKLLKQTLAEIKEIDWQSMKETQARLDDLTKPLGSLGRLEELARLIVAITGNKNPTLKNKVVITMAGDHGIAEDGVSAYPREVTAQMVYNFARGGAGINVLARHVGARVVVVDMGVAVDLEPSPAIVVRKVRKGTDNMTKGPAMTVKEAVIALEAGIELVEDCSSHE